jgi:hypothetical protein
MSSQRGGKLQGRTPKGYGQGKGSHTNKKTMTGAEEALGDNVYPYNDQKAGDKFSRTTEAVVNLIEKKITNVGAKVADSIRKMERMDLSEYEPEEPVSFSEKGEVVPKPLTRFEEMKLSQELRDYSTLKRQYESGMEEAFGIILGQCTPGMMAKLEQRNDWEEVRDSHDPIELLKSIKEISHNTQDHEYKIKSIVQAFRNLLECKQADNEGLNSYVKRFKNTTDLIEAQCGGTPLFLKGYAKANEVSIKEAYDRVLAYLLIENSSGKKSGELLKKLDNDYAAAEKGKGDEVFPKDLAEAVSRVTTYKPMMANTSFKKDHTKNNTEDETAKAGFVQPGKSNKGGKKGGKKEIKCFRCGQMGHYASDCQESLPDKSGGSERKAAQFMMCQAVTLTGTNEQFAHLRNSVLLDNQSTADIFCNLNYLQNIREVPETLTLHTNGGVLTCNTKGELKGYGVVWCHPKAIANILGMSNVLEGGKYNVTFDDSVGFTMKNKKTGATTVFARDGDGLFSAPLGPEPNTQRVNLLTTVEENKQLYTKRQVERADTARKLYQVIGFPSIRDYKHLVQTNQIKNCPVTVDDINVCENIYGPDIYSMKGKTVRPKPKVVVNDYLEVPTELVEAHKKVILCMDIMFIDEVRFLITVSKHLKYITIRFIENRKTETLLEALKPVISTYNKAGFTIHEVHCDREFEHAKTDLESEYQLTVNLTAAQEHEPTVERTIITIKERYKAMYHLCPYKMWPNSCKHLTKK